MIYDTEVFEFSDLNKAKEIFDSFRGKLTEMGATDVRFLEHTDGSGKALVAMWWPSAEACHAFNDKYGPEIMEAAGPITKSAEPDQLWKEV